MAAKITFFPVGNGDMTLITLGDPEETRILVDINIQNDSDNNQMPCDVPKELRKRLGKDKEGRPYIDAFLLSHPDEDHCRGLQKHFHLGPLEEYVFEPPEGEEQKKNRYPGNVVLSNGFPSS